MPDPIERLRALLEAASPGPWHIEGYDEALSAWDVHSPDCEILSERSEIKDARAIAAWMNLRDGVLSVLDAVINHEDDDYGLRCAIKALLVDIEREVGDA